MKRVKIICLYCGTIRTSWIYSISEFKSVKCDKCSDKNVKIESLESNDCFGYNSDNKDVANKTLSVYNKESKE